MDALTYHRGLHVNVDEHRTYCGGGIVRAVLFDALQESIGTRLQAYLSTYSSTPPSLPFKIYNKNLTDTTHIRIQTHPPLKSQMELLHRGPSLKAESRCGYRPGMSTFIAGTS